ncbi:exodeoxyribonuclease V subunit alpha [Rhodococcus globerulus]|jgi:exodeoxyribonuclease V alpha subunit|uniref:RecBCD enzyme subunit RecD n=1 Tax=Rhodococcus globerulus TaxID=33008 RepID=A0ABU4BW59_RHOGO|nr:exodeoxyribonuclease V subunit alpha [Rhodococcus globerulus]MDV6268442.1 exodeoxyribonuclease V subunit alpha [Rhodococcus globerulus]
MTEAQLAQRARGIVRTFNEAGVLLAADVHVAVRLCTLGGEPSPGVMLVAALAVRAVRSGSVCLDLRRMQDVSVDGATEAELAALPWPEPEAVISALRLSPLVIGGTAGPLRPLRLVDSDDGELLYLDRYFLQEQTIRRVLDERAETHPTVDTEQSRTRLQTTFQGDSGHTSGPDRQRIAAALSLTHWTTVIAGGPGTGKTHTVARILALLLEEHGSELRIGLAAPTGKAAARLQESVREQAEQLKLPADLTAMTLHRLLGWQRGSASRFKYNASNRLPFDVIVVDETSMVSLTLMARLLEAVRPDARLLLVGDPDQLTSVDAGAVLADLVARPSNAEGNKALADIVGADLEPGGTAESLTAHDRERLRGGIVQLSRGRRFGGIIAQLASAVREGKAEEVIGLLRSGDPAVSFHAPEDLDALRSDIVTSAESATGFAKQGDAMRALKAMESHRLLCAHRDGPYGVSRWAKQAMDWVGAAAGEFLNPEQWYPGQPLLVTANDYEVGIYNGDTGVIVEGDGGVLMAAFQRGDNNFQLHPSSLSSVQTVYAMTIHRSQGSQYDTVSVMLPAEASSLLTRELLYTAITRARTHVRVIGTEESVRAGVERQVLRASGLRRAIRPYDG